MARLRNADRHGFSDIADIDSIEALLTHWLRIDAPFHQRFGEPKIVLVKIVRTDKRVGDARGLHRVLDRKFGCKMWNMHAALEVVNAQIDDMPQLRALCGLHRGQPLIDFIRSQRGCQKECIGASERRPERFGLLQIAQHALDSVR